KHIDPNVFDKLLTYYWPVNIRELKHANETAYNNISSTTMTTDDFPTRIMRGRLPDRHIKNNLGLQEQMENSEKDLIVHALKKNDWVYAYAAQELQISRQSLQYKMKKYQLL